MSALPTAAEVADRLSAALAEAGRPDLRGVIRTCPVCGGPRAYINPSPEDARESAAKAFQVVFRRPTLGRVARRSETIGRPSCTCEKYYAGRTA